MGETVDVNDRLGSELARLALDAITLGVVVTDRLARRVYSNSQADRLLSDHGGALHIIRGNRIGAAGRETQKFLHATIEQVCGRDGRAERHHILASAADGKRPDLAVCVSPVATNGSAHGHESAMILLRVIERACDMEVEARRLFGLTRMQAKFASSIASGLSLAEAARSHAVTLETARTHMKAIFRKTGFCRQGQVAALMRGAQTPIQPIRVQADGPFRIDCRDARQSALI